MSLQFFTDQGVKSFSSLRELARQFGWGSWGGTVRGMRAGWEDGHRGGYLYRVAFPVVGIQAEIERFAISSPPSTRTTSPVV